MNEFLRRKNSDPNALVECRAEDAEHVASIVRAKAIKLGLSEEDAEDVVQETFFAALLIIRKGDGDAIHNWRGLFVRVGEFKCVDAKRVADKRIRTCIYLDAEPIDKLWQEYSAAEQVERVESIAVVQAAICRLRDKDRLVVTYCDLEEHTYAEAAAYFGLTVRAVHSRLVRARKSLRLKLKAYYFAESMSA